MLLEVVTSERCRSQIMPQFAKMSTSVKGMSAEESLFTSQNSRSTPAIMSNVRNESSMDLRR